MDTSHVEKTGEKNQPDTLAKPILRVSSIVNSAQVSVGPKLLDNEFIYDLGCQCKQKTYLQSK